MDKPKRRSQKRFEQLNHLVDNVAPSLPSATHTAALLCCYRHAKPSGVFSVSTDRLAAAIGVKRRRMQQIFDELESLGVIRLIEPHKGPLPAKYLITGNAANAALQCAVDKRPNSATQCAIETTVDSAPQCAISDNEPPKRNAHSSALNGALQCT